MTGKEENNNYNNDMAELIKRFTTAMGESKQIRVKEPNTYDGTRDALLIDGWIRSVERYVNFQGWSAERSYLFGTTLLRDRADAWFRTIELTDEAPATWLELKRLITEFFRPDNSVRIARDRLAVLKQTGDLVTYINNFMDIKLAIPGMTDDEGCDKFVRGLTSKQMRSHIRQYEANTLKEAIHAALAFDSAQYEDDSFNSTSRPKQRAVVDDPMELDAIDDRNYQRSRFNNNYSRNQNYSYGYSRNQNSSAGYSRERNNRTNNYSRNNSGGSTASCYYCHKIGHLKRNCRTRLSDIKKLDDQHSKKDFRLT
jgi:hypothetical protein